MAVTKAGLGSLLQVATARLSAAGVESARLDAELLLAQVFGYDRTRLLANLDREVSAAQIDLFNEYLRRRSRREPLAYITSKKEFYGLDLICTPAALIPRPETEFLVQSAVEHAARNARVIDAGTGSGAIALALAASRDDLNITATDTSEMALTLARQNALNLNLKINWCQADIFPKNSTSYDMVVANLPYLPNDAIIENELSYEPKAALLGGQGGLGCYRKLFKLLIKTFNAPADVIIEADSSQHQRLEDLARPAGFILHRSEAFLLHFQASGRT